VRALPRHRLRTIGRRKITLPPDIRASEINLVEAVIFDFDGTLVDSRKLMVESNRIVFGQFGFCGAARRGDALRWSNVTELVLPQLAGLDAPVKQMMEAYRSCCTCFRADEADAEVPVWRCRRLAGYARWRKRRCGSGSPPGTYPMHNPALERFGWHKHFCPGPDGRTRPRPSRIRNGLQALGEARVKAKTPTIKSATPHRHGNGAGRLTSASWRYRGHHRPDRLHGAGRVAYRA